MILFEIKEKIELFTVCDYKRLILTITDYVNHCCIRTGIMVSSVVPYYNPECQKGIIQYESTEIIYLQDMDFAVGDDIVTVTFL